jgi:UDP-glucose 4-epimerase
MNSASVIPFPTKYHGPHVIVTGGSGYVGGHICKALNIAEYVPINIDRNITSWSDKWGPFYNGDFQPGSNVIQEVLKSHDVVAVIHCAANSLVGLSVSTPAIYYKNNVINTIYFLNYLKDNGYNNFVFSSSSSVYGNQEVVPIKEDAVLNPLTSYGRSKQMIEGVLQDYDTGYDFHSVSLRYFNACGADFDQEVGQVKNATHVIAKILESLLNSDTFTINGTDYNTPDSTCVRDYTHVWDLALAHVKAIDYLIKGGQTEIINLGAGQGHGVWDILDSVNNVVKWLPEIKKGDRRQGDPEKVIADISKAKKILDWVPEHSDLNTIIDTAWKWYKSETYLRSN